MAFGGLAQKLQDIFQKLTARGKLTEADVRAAMREVKLALLEADVNFLVVKKFIANVQQRAVGSEVLESLTPGQQVIKIVNEELIQLLGGKVSPLSISPKPPTILLMCGLQGTGKTTMCGKLAMHFKKNGKFPLLVACDIYRPAAIDQLKVVGGQADVPVFSMGQEKPKKIFAHALDYARKNGNDLIIVDTAGRLHIDESMMQELKELKQAANPNEVLLVVDAMTGQDAVNVAKAFHEAIGMTGVILTKIDGDTRGGAALSVREVTGQPIKFVGTGEKLTDFEPFYPDRMASRILNMGDVMTLIEKAEAAFDEKKAAELQKKMRNEQLDLNDFLDQLQEIKKLGSMEDILGMLPGGNKLKGMAMDEGQFKRTEAIILSMTKKERQNPGIINASRRKRIAKGCGQQVQDVNRLLNQFEQMNKMMKQFRGKGGKRRRGIMGMPF